VLPLTREVEAAFDGPTITCPTCSARIAISPPTGWSVRSPQDVYAHLGIELAALEREELRIILLNAKNMVLRVVTAYSGNVSASPVRVGELFREAVRDNVTSVILVHNHPSGDATPSPDDVDR
jgi:DNA repair protein RadC